MYYEIAEFLKSNGFRPINPDTYTNDKCQITHTKDGYEVWFDDFTWYMHEHNIYQLVGFLTWNSLMDKNYKQV